MAVQSLIPMADHYAAFTIIITPIAIFIMPFFVAIIITMWVAMRAGSMSNVILELPINFFKMYV